MLRKDEMDLFNTFGSHNNSIKVDEAKWILTKNILTIAMMFIFGYMQYFLASNIADKSYMLIIFYMATCIISLVLGIVRSQSILFNAKDNALLLSLPIKKHEIIISRIVILLASQYGLCLIIMLPAILVYIMLETPMIMFYVNALVSVALLPIVPTILGALIGYIIQLIASNRKKRNIIQLLLTVVSVVLVFIVLINMDAILQRFGIVATSLEEFLLNLYYPLGVMYIGIENFTLFEIFITLIINVATFLVFALVLRFGFFKILRNLMIENIKVKTSKMKFKKRNIHFSLVRKELKRYLSSPIHIFNTMLTPMIVLILLIYISIVGIENLAEFINLNVSTLKNMVLNIWLPISIMVFSSSATTSCSISLEGKKNWINRSIPVDSLDIFLSKIIASIIVMFPVMLINTFIFIRVFDVTIIIGSLFVIVLFIISLFISFLGLLINLIVPNMDYINEVAVIKQSKSNFATTILVIIFGAICNWIYGKVGYENIIWLLVGTSILVCILCHFIWKVLKNQGKYRYENI